MNVSAFNRIPMRVSMLCVDCECISSAAAACACGSTHTMLLAPVLNRSTEPAKLRLVAGGMGISISRSESTAGNRALRRRGEGN
jgi:hypothetical protein